jgi:hypothetical protein
LAILQLVVKHELRKFLSPAEIDFAYYERQEQQPTILRRRLGIKKDWVTPSVAPYVFCENYEVL